ncbi:hypothetical protein BCL93_10186 [Onishia taeanensis]|uniref:Uncharacterized protein n=1 Tax=Onishia taeanensis TaxID=284577 RepID=A0A328XWC2_9GAMM|nr:hypothetical protein [Halomonas taeanensis]RAR64268.1 hypothetical protein BCL93_10186 [Halomonas taeanensis]
MESNEQVLMDSDSLTFFTARADELIDRKDHRAIKSTCDKCKEADFIFESPYDESCYYYSVANLYTELYSYSQLDWFYDDLSMAVLYFRKAPHAIGESPCPQGKVKLGHDMLRVNFGNCV